MSEYQYYEFRAIDRPLHEEEMDELRRLSTRAEITPTSFTNTYHWGDFKGNPFTLMDRYFDAFVYVANWGTHKFMFRLPRVFGSQDGRGLLRRRVCLAQSPRKSMSWSRSSRRTSRVVNGPKGSPGCPR